MVLKDEECDELIDKYVSWLDFHCILHFDEDLRYVFIFQLATIMGFICWLFHKSIRKIKNVQDPNLSMSENQTYCIFTLKILELTQLILILAFISVGWVMFQIILNQNYIFMFIQSCDIQNKQDLIVKPQYYIIHNFFETCEFLCTLLIFYVFMFQIFEWIAMLYIVKT